MKSCFSNTRRVFLKSTAALGVGYWASGRASADDASQSSPSEKINFACIGVGGKGESDTADAGKAGNVVAICDVDDDRLNKAGQRYPDAKKFHDFRNLFDEMAGKIDAVTVSTPDHVHAVAAVRAMREGKAVFCQKPLTHTLWEARRMAEIAKEKNVATQMGNQGTAQSVQRKSVAMVQAGVIGQVAEVHVWTNRPSPYWKQGLPRPASSPVPKNLHWNLWLGPAPKRDFAAIYHPKDWRGWWDFGCGPLGDMGCHTMNMPFRSLELRNPISVMAETSGHNRDSYPAWSIIHYEFAATSKRPAVKLTWYDGGKRPPAELLDGAELTESGSLLIGDKGKLYSPGDDGVTRQLLGGAKEIDVTITESPGHFQEFANAVKGGPPAMSNFPDWAGPLTEVVLLGNLAVWTADGGSGPKIDWDAKNLRAVNVPGLDHMIKSEYRGNYSI